MQNGRSAFDCHIAAELRRRCDLQMRDVPSDVQDFVELTRASTGGSRWGQHE
jgi:hypothetical protein